MAKAKKKKKYVPKPVYYPNLVISIHVFTPFEKALDALIETEEVHTDENGTYIYYDGGKIAQSFEAGLKVYKNFVDLYCKRSGAVIDTAPLEVLRQAMIRKEGFDEDEILQARECIQGCKELISKIPAKLSRELLGIVRVLFERERLETPVFYEEKDFLPLKNPEVTDDLPAAPFLATAFNERQLGFADTWLKASLREKLDGVPDTICLEQNAHEILARYKVLLGDLSYPEVISRLSDRKRRIEQDKTLSEDELGFIKHEHKRYMAFADAFSLIKPELKDHVGLALVG